MDPLEKPESQKLESDKESNDETEEENATSPTDWWRGLYRSTQEIYESTIKKSTHVMELVKKDLNELSTTVKTEATNVVEQTTTLFQDTLQLDKPESTAATMKKSMSTFLEQVTSVLNPAPDDDEQEAVIVQGSEVVPLTRLQTQLYALGSDPETYLKEIEPSLLPRFEAWLELVEEEGNKQLSNEKLIKMLVNNPQLQTNYENLVPNQISHALFWNRYLFRKAMLEDEDAKLQRKSQKRDTDDEVDEENIEKDDFNYNLELSEEDQIKLLEDYEKEKQSKMLQKEKDSKDEKSGKMGKKTSDGALNVREKKDMVIVGDLTNSTTSSTYSSKGSTEEDWEKEINMDDVEGDLAS